MVETLRFRRPEHGQWFCTFDNMEQETRTVQIEFKLVTKAGFIKIKSDFVNTVTVKEINL